jgi:hypothetical protein
MQKGELKREPYPSEIEEVVQVEVEALTTKNEQRRKKKHEKRGGSDMSNWNSSRQSSRTDVQKFIEQWEPRLQHWETVMMKLEKFTISNTESDELVEVKVDVPENSAEKSVPADPLLQKPESSGRRKKTVHLEEESDKQSEDSHIATSGSNASGASPGEAKSSNDDNDDGDQL